MHVTVNTFVFTWKAVAMLYVSKRHLLCNRYHIKTHDSESRGQEEAGRTRDEQVSYLHVAPL